jgi:hypothetical protein
MHGRHIAPCLGNSVEAATRLRVSRLANTSDDVYVKAYNCSAAGASRTQCVELLYLQQQHNVTIRLFSCKIGQKKATFYLRAQRTTGTKVQTLTADRGS